ncbi:unnamed protein product [Gongylonema pulchrum]|uniref:Protein kinase domain-containing protein n=1 Tax=Gongylonema pulchrum TaxID=637853 RepID=A0A183DTL8_9BILA|nr:unnamed protein product [Gongylonema pulchrum]
MCEFLQVLSSGHYGRIYVGKLQAKTGKETMDVAVKGCKDAAKYVHMKALVDELRIMIAIRSHPNVLCLIGAVTENIRKSALAFCYFATHSLYFEKSCLKNSTFKFIMAFQQANKVTMYM